MELFKAAKTNFFLEKKLRLCKDESNSGFSNTEMIGPPNCMRLALKESECPQHHHHHHHGQYTTTLWSWQWRYDHNHLEKGVFSHNWHYGPNDDYHSEEMLFILIWHKNHGHGNDNHSCPPRWNHNPDIKEILHSNVLWRSPLWKEAFSFVWSYLTSQPWS